jgi:glutaredoxin 2
VELSDEVTSHENQLLGGNADKFSFAELERLKRQHFKDKKGMMIVAGYEALSLVAIGRIAKILAKGQVRKFLTKSSEVEILLSTATRHKSLMKKLSKKGIETPGQFGQYLKGLSKKEQVKFGEEMMKYHFGAGTIFTGAIALKELGDTHYFMYGFPYIPQGISAID